MAKEANAATVSMGRNFLNIAALASFLRSNEAKQLDARTLRNVEDTYSCFLKDFTTIEVNVVEIRAGFGVCNFHIRGPLVHQIVVPAQCLKLISPVIPKAAAPSGVYSEFDRLYA